VEFTARQYYHIYKSRFENKSNDDVITLLKNKAKLWRMDKNSCCEWGRY